MMQTSPELRGMARVYLPWAAISPVLGVICFPFAGIVPLAFYMRAWWLLEARFGNHGLWAALNIFFAARGLTFASRVPSLQRRAFA